MIRIRPETAWIAGVLALSGVGMVHAQVALPRDPPPARVTYTIGADVPALSGYVFRGIVQEFAPTLTVQPFVDVGVAVSERVRLHVGMWNSLHSGSLRKNIGAFYASHLYAAATVRRGRWTPGVQYTLYTSPAGGYDLVGRGGSIGISELAVSTTVDDHDWWLPLSPRVLVATELTTTQADFGSRRGTYAEIGITPSWAIRRWALTLTAPAVAGYSVRHYFERFDGRKFRDSAFGYGQVGIDGRAPLRRFGAGRWSAHAGLSVVMLGSGREVSQAHDTKPTWLKPVLTVGASATY